MKFKYLGDADEVTLWGLTFPIGKAVEVADEFVIGKLEGNSHFEVVKARKNKKTAAEEAAEAEQAVKNAAEAAAHAEQQVAEAVAAAKAEADG